MYYVGIDLAWGHRRPTGVAVLQADGVLLHVSAQTDDASIAGALEPYVDGPCVVGIDAPLVVTNPTGNRPAEAALNRDFARFDAGAHPSNTGKPEFADGTRGGVLAHDPRPRPGSGVHRRPSRDRGLPARRDGRAVPARAHAEVQEQARPQPGGPARRAAAADAGASRACATACRRCQVDHQHEWKSLLTQVEGAQRKSDLRRVEDQVDAVVCAYVAMFATARPDDTTVYGDAATGAIVTPTLPEGHLPSPRSRRAPLAEPVSAPAPVQEGPVRRAVQTYAALHPQLRDVTDRFVALVTTLLDDAGINYLSVTGRTKSVASFATKADRELDGVPLFADPLEQITDQIGLRVITYIHSDVEAVAHLLGDALTVLDDRDMGQETAREGRFGYASRHLLVTPRAGEETSYDPLVGRRAQVQVRTVLQHAWAEFEHAIRYKGTIPAEYAPDLDRRFTLAAGLLELADREFSEIRHRLQASVTDVPEQDAHDPRISSEDLAAFLAAQYADAGWSRTDHYAWVSGLLLELGVTSLDELAGLLTSVDSGVLNERMDYRYPPGAVRRLDDALLAIFGTRYLGLHGNAHREDLLRARLDKLRTPA